MSILDQSEASVRAKVKAYAESKGWLILILDYSGWPDCVYVGPQGQHVYIEFKRPKGGRHKLLQKHRLATLVAQGCDAFLVKTVERGKEIVDKFSSCEPCKDWDSEVPCKYCGAIGLHWEIFTGEWRLFDGDLKLHSCKEYREENRVDLHSTE